MQADAARSQDRDVARLAFVATLVVVGVVAGSIALWKLRLLLSLFFLAFILAAAMRPSIDALARRRVPRPVGILLHYVALAALIALALWLIVPQALHQVEAAIGSGPASANELRHAARHSTGIKHELLLGLEKRLRHLPSPTTLLHPALTITAKALELLVGVFFVLASAAYWVLERDRAEAWVLSLLPRQRRRVVRETWRLIDLKLGAFVRGQLLMITLVSTILSLAFWQIGLPYWLLLGTFAGIVEILPVIGPFAAGAVAIGVGLTMSLETAALAAIAVYGLRLFQDYVLGPRVLGHAVGLPPLVVLTSVSAVGILFGPATVPLATPFAAVLATLIDVIARGKDPAKEEPPKVLVRARRREPTPGR
jgi:predicted PurR-regulated permease PerM